MNTISITLEDGSTATHPIGAAVSALLTAPGNAAGLPYIAALVNNDLVSLSYPLTVDSRVRFLAMDDPHGWRVYRRSLCFLLAKAVHALFPDASLNVEHSFGLGLYCSFSAGPDAENGLSAGDRERLVAHMEELVERDIPIERRKIAYTDALAEFERSGRIATRNLLAHRNPPRVVLHWCEGFSDLAHGPLAPSTGALSQFEIIPYPRGFVLHLPDRTDPTRIPPFEDQPHLFRIFQEHKEWGRILGVSTVGKLNELTAAGESLYFVRTAEALHEKKVARIADAIAEARDRIRFVLVAGPSCAGKTTFAKRLTVHLTVNGIRPVTLGADDYFVGPEQNPLGDDGKPDFEHLEAVDIDLLNRHLVQLMNGETIDRPTYNFGTKQREYRGDRITLDPDTVLIVEGIHGLNPRLTHAVPTACTFRIYVSALTQLSLDVNNRISTTDNRLMRRIVRDHQFRGHSALDTLRMWPNVRRGEKRWIFPFQQNTDATFNSALDYELGVLKPLVEPLLMQVKPSHPEYAEARRLTEFLLNFTAIPSRYVPAASILREYIGGSGFEY